MKLFPTCLNISLLTDYALYVIESVTYMPLTLFDVYVKIDILILPLHIIMLQNV